MEDDHDIARFDGESPAHLPVEESEDSEDSEVIKAYMRPAYEAICKCVEGDIAELLSTSYDELRKHKTEQQNVQLDD